MPCRVDPTPEELAEEHRRHEQKITGPLHEEISVLKAKLEEREAMLCAVMSSVERSMIAVELIDNINEQEAGVTREEIRAWFAEHKSKDAARRARELEEDARKREALLARLTPEERALLGV